MNSEKNKSRVDLNSTWKRKKEKISCDLLTEGLLTPQAFCIFNLTRSSRNTPAQTCSNLQGKKLSRWQEPGNAWDISMWLTYKLGFLKFLTWHLDTHTLGCHMMWLKEEVRRVGRHLSANGKTVTASGHSCFFFPFVFSADSIAPLVTVMAFSGTYELESQENYEEFLEAIGTLVLLLTCCFYESWSGPGPSCCWLTNLTDCLSQDFSVPRQTTRWQRRWCKKGTTSRGRNPFQTGPGAISSRSARSVSWWRWRASNLRWVAGSQQKLAAEPSPAFSRWVFGWGFHLVVVHL